MLNVTIYCYVECRYAERRAECRCAECRYAECSGTSNRMCKRSLSHQSSVTGNPY
jgi:hypothetical protein